jgi:hypothetical protein
LFPIFSLAFPGFSPALSLNESETPMDSSLYEQKNPFPLHKNIALKICWWCGTTSLGIKMKQECV